MDSRVPLEPARADVDREATRHGASHGGDATRAGAEGEADTSREAARKTRRERRRSIANTDSPRQRRGNGAAHHDEEKRGSRGAGLAAGLLLHLNIGAPRASLS